MLIIGIVFTFIYLQLYMCLRNKGKTFTSNFCRCRSVYLHIAKMCRNVCSECSDRSGADFLSLLWDLGLGRHVSMVWRCLEWRLQYPESRNYGLHIIKYRWRQLVQMPVYHLVKIFRVQNRLLKCESQIGVFPWKYGLVWAETLLLTLK